MNLKSITHSTLFEADNGHRILQDLKIRKLNRYGVVKLRVPKGTVLRVSKTFLDVVQNAKGIVRFENGFLYVLKDVHMLADSFSLEKNEIKNIRHILLHEKGKISKWSKPIYSIKLRNICEKSGIKKFTVPGGVPPLCFEDQIVVSIKDKNYFYITTKDHINQAEFILLDLQSKKAKTNNKKIMMY